MSLILTPGKEMCIKRKRFVVIEDVVSDQFPKLKDSLPLQHQNDVAIFCSLKGLMQIRKSYPELPVYGIWQLAFASRLILDKPLYIIYFDTTRQSGQFLYQQSGNIISGRIVNGEILNVIVGIDLSLAEVIHFEKNNIHFPLAPVQTYKEREQLAWHNKKKMMTDLGSGLLACVVVFACVSYWFNHHGEELERQEKQLQEELSSLKNKRDILARHHIQKWPNQWRIFYPMMRMIDEGVHFNVWGFSFDQAVLSIELPSQIHIEIIESLTWLKALPNVVIRHKSDDSVHISWANQPSGLE